MEIERQLQLYGVRWRKSQKSMRVVENRRNLTRVMPLLLKTFQFFWYALQYDINSSFPEMLVALARHKNKIVGMAGAIVDCKCMREINVDVLPPYRGKGLASALVNMLTIEILKREYVPYYFTSDSNVFSVRAAIRAGYTPAWVHCYKTRLDLLSR